MIDELRSVWNYDPIRFDMYWIVPLGVMFFIGILFYLMLGHDHQMTTNQVCHFSPGHFANGDQMNWEMI